MPNSYRAILRGNHLDWVGEDPARSGPVPVEVILRDEPRLGAERSDGARMAAVLEEVATAPVYRRAGDPAGWQRMVREDRPMPGRD